MNTAPSMSPTAAYDRLMEGNRRFVTGTVRHGSGLDAGRRAALAGGQEPFATILACADSRVAPEHVFDAGLGDLFVCRNAGNLLDELILGSVEYAVAHLGCPLVCVMGHRSCGACAAAVAALRDPATPQSPGIDDIVRRLAPAVLAAGNTHSDDRTRADASARKNVELVCRQLFQRSTVLAARAVAEQVQVMGALYDLESGWVEIVVPPDGAA